MSANPSITFLNTNKFDKFQILNEIIDMYPKLGFEILHVKIGKISIAWSETKKTEIMKLAKKEKGIILECKNQEMDIEFGQNLFWNEDAIGGKNRVWIQTYTFGTAYFWDSVNTSEKYSELLLTIGVKLYEIIKPSFGWIDFDFGLFTSFEDVELIRQPTLYWANFFGPAYVNKLSEKKIYGAPGWKIEKLSDNGILYVLSPGLGLSSKPEDANVLRTYFGVKKVR